MNFQDDIASIPIDDFKDHYILVCDKTWKKDATENCHYPELSGEPPRLELNFTSPLKHVTDLIVLGNECLQLHSTKLVLLERISWMDIVPLQWIFNRIAELKHRYLGPFPSDFFPILPNDIMPI